MNTRVIASEAMERDQAPNAVWSATDGILGFWWNGEGWRRSGRFQPKSWLLASPLILFRLCRVCPNCHLPLLLSHPESWLASPASAQSLTAALEEASSARTPTRLLRCRHQQAPHCWRLRFLRGSAAASPQRVGGVKLPIDESIRDVALVEGRWRTRQAPGTLDDRLAAMKTQRRGPDLPRGGQTHPADALPARRRRGPARQLVARDRRARDQFGGTSNSHPATPGPGVMYADWLRDDPTRPPQWENPSSPRSSPAAGQGTSLHGPQRHRRHLHGRDRRGPHRTTSTPSFSRHLGLSGLLLPHDLIVGRTLT